jgi:SAM-dependent methyltransferase
VIAAQPYAALAPYYQRVMEHVDYASWADYLTLLLKTHRKEPESLLELGAGSGLLACHFHPASVKFRVTTDISYEMIALANPEYAGYRAVADASALPFMRSFDMILMTYDAINYLSSMGVQSLFSEVHRLLSEGGVFIFDVTTEHNSLTYFSEATSVDEFPGEAFVMRRSWYERSTREQYNHFDFFECNTEGLYSHKTETHCQTIYPLNFFAETARTASLEVEAMYADFRLKTDVARANRVFFILSRKVS